MAATIAPTASPMRSVMLSVLPRIVLAPVQGKRSRGHGVPAPGGRRRALTQTGAGSGAAVHPKGNSRFPNQETDTRCLRRTAPAQQQLAARILNARLKLP